MGDWPEGDEAEFDAHQREVAEDWRQLYGGGVCDVVTIHPDRDISKADGPWRPVRQPWFLQFTPDIPELVEIGEPIGPQSSVAEDADPLRLTMAAAVGALCGAGAYCLHTGAGIRGGGAANLWEVRHIEATLAGLVRRGCPAAGRPAELGAPQLALGWPSAEGRGSGDRPL